MQNSPDEASVDSLRIWAVSDAAAGNRRQAEALAFALSDRVENLQIATRAPWRWLAPRLLPGAIDAFGPHVAARLQGTLPDLAIGCGRQAALFTRLLGGLDAGRCRSVQILDPRIDPAHWDLVVAPRHDDLQGANVIATLGSLHPIDARWLAQARMRFAPLGALPSPRIGVLLGGPTRAAPWNTAWWKAVAEVLAQWQQSEGGSVFVVGSRRTPAWLRDRARAFSASAQGRAWFDEGDGENPYAGVLAHAERLVVSPDSVNLLSEACAVGVPVLTHAPRPPGGRVGRFLRELIEAGQVRPLRAPFSSWQVEPLRELAGVAVEVRQRLGLAPQGNIAPP
jgi:uncharacterized protein